MNGLRSIVRSNAWLYDFARGALMHWRRRRFGLRAVHKTFYLSGGCQVNPDLAAEEFSYIGPGCILGPQVQLGRYTMLGPRVSVVGGDHVFDQPGIPIIFAGRPILPQTIIEADAWIGCGAILLAGVRIGRGAIIAAGAVVTKNVPAYEIHAGVPARKLRDRFADQNAREIHDRMLNEPPRRRDFCPPLELKPAA